MFEYKRQWWGAEVNLPQWFSIQILAGPAVIKPNLTKLFLAQTSEGIKDAKCCLLNWKVMPVLIKNSRFRGAIFLLLVKSKKFYVFEDFIYVSSKSEQ